MAFPSTSNTSAHPVPPSPSTPEDPAEAKAALNAAFPPPKYNFSSFYFQAIIELDTISVTCPSINHEVKLSSKKQVVLDLLNKLHDKMLGARRHIWERQTQNRYRIALMSSILPPPPPQAQLSLAWRQKPLTTQASELCDHVTSMVLAALEAVKRHHRVKGMPAEEHDVFRARMNGFTGALYRFKSAICEMVDEFGNAIADLSPAVTRSLGNVAFSAFVEVEELVQAGAKPKNIISIDLPYFYDEFDIKMI